MVGYLLNGMSDDKLEIGPMCIDFLEEHGKRMKEAMKALGDEDFEDEEEAKDQSSTTGQPAADTETAGDTEMKTTSQ